MSEYTKNYCDVEYKFVPYICVWRSTVALPNLPDIKIV
jgi:hypothetical protein